MKIKSLLITVVILGVAVWAAIILQDSETAKQAPVVDELVGEPVLTNEEVNALQEIVILANEQTCVLQQADGMWVVPDHYGLPVNFASLQRLVNSFTEAKFQRKVTANTDVMERFELDANQVTFKGADGVAIKALNIGKTSEAGERFVQLNGEGPAYLMSFEGFLNSDAQGWASKQIKGFKADEIVKVELELEEGSRVIATRADADAAFTVEGLAAGETAKTDEITGMLSKFASINAIAVHPLDHADAQAAKTHSRVIAFTNDAGAVHTYRIGRRPAADADSNADSDGETEADDAETPKPGPVFVFVESSDATAQAELQRYMAKASFTVAEHLYTSLPKVRSDIVEPAPETPAEPELPAEPATSANSVIVEPVPLESPTDAGNE